MSDENCCSGGTDSEGEPRKADKSCEVHQNCLLGNSEDAKPSSSSGPETLTQKEDELRKKLDLLAFGPQRTAAKTLTEAKQKSHAFWETQPVPSFDEAVTTSEAVEPDKDVSEIRKDSYSLPPGFVWTDVVIDDQHQLQELYTLLNENYVEDDDNMFRFDYSPDFLKWALKSPGWQPCWHCGVRVKKSGKLIGFIAAIACTVKVYDQVRKMVEINFLCVHKKLRAKRVAPVLIREITRRVNLQGVFQAVYTAGVILPRPISTCRYWHRSLNPKKLIEVKFSHLGKNMTLQRTLKLYKLPDEPRLSGLRQMTPGDQPAVYELLSDYLRRFDLAPMFSKDEFQHWFLPRLDVVDTYVIEQADGRVTDMVSFYTLPSSVMHHSAYKTLKAAYAFYTVARSVHIVDLMNDALIVAKKNNYDVFNALDLMENKEFLEKLKFGIGDGNLQYYLYNWKCPELPAHKVGLVLQ